FRNVGSFHEDCTVAIGKKVVALIKPKFLRIGGYWYPRGGIPIDVFWQHGRLPAGVLLPEQGGATYPRRGCAARPPGAAPARRGPRPAPPPGLLNQPQHPPPPAPGTGRAPPAAHARNAEGTGGQPLGRPRRIEPADREHRDRRRGCDLGKALAADLGAIAG